MFFVQIGVLTKRVVSFPVSLFSPGFYACFLLFDFFLLNYSEVSFDFKIKPCGLARALNSMHFVYKKASNMNQ